MKCKHCGRSYIPSIYYQDEEEENTCSSCDNIIFVMKVAFKSAFKQMTSKKSKEYWSKKLENILYDNKK